MSNKNYNLIIYQLIIDNLFNYFNDYIHYENKNDIRYIKYTLTQLFKIPSSDLHLIYSIWNDKINNNYLNIIKLYEKNIYDIDNINDKVELQEIKLKYINVLNTWIKSFPTIYQELFDNFDYKFNNELKNNTKLSYTDYKIITFLNNFQKYLNQN